MRNYPRYANGSITSGWRCCFSRIVVACAVSGSVDLLENACLHRQEWRAGQRNDGSERTVFTEGRFVANAVIV
jgi:hypothetical protein